MILKLKKIPNTRLTIYFNDHHTFLKPTALTAERFELWGRTLLENSSIQCRNKLCVKSNDVANYCALGILGSKILNISDKNLKNKLYLSLKDLNSVLELTASRNLHGFYSSLNDKHQLSFQTIAFINYEIATFLRDDKKYRYLKIDGENVLCAVSESDFF